MYNHIKKEDTMNIRYLIALVCISVVISIQPLYKEPITTREGYLFTIKVPSAPATGFDWFFGNEKELKDYVQLVKTEFASNPSFSGRLGKKIFTFKALKDGKIIIKLIKRKSWEEKEADHFLFKVHIKKADLNPEAYKVTIFKTTAY